MGSTSFFIPKKHKKAMRDRRRKKRLAEKGELHLFVQNDEPKKKCRTSPPEEEEMATTAVVATNDTPSPPASNTASIHIPRSNKIKIPFDIQSDSKKVKKFRKDIRRQARSEGRDDSQLVFVLEKAPSDRKTFPRINDLLEQEEKQQQKAASTSVTAEDLESTLSDEVKRQYVALDCEMVGTGTNGQTSVLARASIVDWWGNVLLDTYVKVPVAVTDFRTQYSGIRPQHLQRKSSMDPAACRQRVAEILRDKILVGHALHNDLNCLMLQHPNVRDTATFRPLQRLAPNGKWRPRKLKTLVAEQCDGMVIQEGSHDSVQDARASMQLFQSVYTAWEQERAAKEALQRKKKR